MIKASRKGFQHRIDPKQQNPRDTAPLTELKITQQIGKYVQVRKSLVYRQSASQGHLCKCRLANRLLSRENWYLSDDILER